MFDRIHLYGSVMGNDAIIDVIGGSLVNEDDGRLCFVEDFN